MGPTLNIIFWSLKALGIPVFPVLPCAEHVAFLLVQLQPTSATIFGGHSSGSVISKIPVATKALHSAPAFLQGLWPCHKVPLPVSMTSQSSMFHTFQTSTAWKILRTWPSSASSLSCSQIPLNQFLCGGCEESLSHCSSEARVHLSGVELLSSTADFSASAWSTHTDSLALYHTNRSWPSSC